MNIRRAYIALSVSLAFLNLAAAEPVPATSTIAPNSSDAYEAVLDQAVDALVNNEPAKLRELFTDGVVKRTEAEYGAGAVDKIIREKFVTFFDDYSRMEPNVTSTTTKDADGNSGIAYYKIFLTKEGEQRPFVVYVVDEKGKLKVGNVLVNVLFRDLNPAGGGPAR